MCNLGLKKRGCYKTKTFSCYDRCNPIESFIVYCDIDVLIKLLLCHNVYYNL